MKKHTGFGFSKLFPINKKIPVSELEDGECQNCGYRFRGHYCPDCGQEVAEFNRPMGFIVYDFMGNFFAFDTRFFRTFKFLLFYPGFLTKEFFEGRRARYSPPFRIFVFLSFVLFLLLSFLTDKSLETKPEINQNSSRVDKNKKIILNEKTENIETQNLNFAVDSAFSEMQINGSVNENLNIDFADLFGGKGNFRSKLNRVADSLQVSLNKEINPEKQKKLQEYITMCRAPEIAVSTLLKYLSWASFILLPLFALILKLFYIRRKQLYIRHLLFSIHQHSFVFMVLILVTSLRLIFNTVPEFVNLILIATIPVYIVFALHNFYHQGWAKTLFKFIGLTFMYNILLGSVVITVFLKSLNLL